ncbi:MAG: metal ABC transporter ATP-binding protein [Bacillota bacterium]|nr:metal ABC transporter ATP-binding protein [Bacillota bacterium]
MVNIENISFSYTSGKPVIENLSINVDDGAYLSVIGENGSGKSTLIKLMLGFYKPTGGKIEIKTKKIGYVSQRIGNLNNKFPITIYELLYCHLKAIKCKDRTQIFKVLKMVGMDGFKNQLIGNLSGGQIQRIFIAKALLGNPELLIFDEIFTGVDEKAQKEILDILSNINKDGITIISVDHNLVSVYKNSSHILKLTNGRGIIYNREDFKEAYYATV